MIKHTWSVLCERASIDSETNQVSIFNVLENMTVFGDPEDVKGIPFNFEVISSWERENEEPCEGSMRIFQRKPSGDVSKDFVTSIDLSRSNVHRTRVKFNGIPLAGPGRYVFQIDYKEGDKKWKKVAELPLSITFQLPGKPGENQ